MKKIIKLLIGISFVLYIFTLISLLFLGFRGYHPEQPLFEYIKRSSNLIPFKTITQYITAYQNGHLNFNILIDNLVGNLILFSPMGLYLPFYSRKLSKVFRFTGFMLLLLFIVEATQIMTRRGSFDIDDFILNMIGAMIGFAVWKMKIVQWVVKRVR